MKKKIPKLQDFFKFNGKLAKAIGLWDSPSVSIEYIESEKCPHCSGDLGKKQESYIIDSPLFQENVKPVKTIL